MVSGGHISEDPVFCTVDKRALERDRIAVVESGAAAGAPVQDLVSSGRTILDTRVRIVDPETRRECEPSRVGEVWVAGPTVCQGYWQRPDETRDTFQAYLADGDGPYLRTGDRGFVRNARAVRHRPRQGPHHRQGSKSLSAGRGGRRRHRPCRTARGCGPGVLGRRRGRRAARDCLRARASGAEKSARRRNRPGDREGRGGRARSRGVRHLADQDRNGPKNVERKTSAADGPRAVFEGRAERSRPLDDACPSRGGIRRPTRGRTPHRLRSGWRNGSSRESAHA